METQVLSKTTESKVRKLKDKGKSLRQISKKLGISRDEVFLFLQESYKQNPPSINKDGLAKKVEKVIKEKNFSHEECSSKKEKLYYSLTSEQLEEHNRRIAYYAYCAGLSIAEYHAMRREIGVARFSHLRKIMTLDERNKKLLRHPPRDHDPLFQMSARELFDVYLEEGKKLFPDKKPLDVFDILTAKGSGFMLIRIDLGKPFIVGNVTIISKKEFGRRLGTEWRTLRHRGP